MTTPSPVFRLPALRCEQLCIGHRGKPLLPPVDVSLEPGRFIAVVGRNGSGKTTWLKTVLGFIRPISGRVVHGRPDLRLAYMPQAITLDPLLPVRASDLVAWGRLDGWSFVRPGRNTEDHESSHAALTATRATAFSNTLFRDLSEGQKQRVLLARLLARGADIAFLDEPTAAMDAIAERDAMLSLKNATRERAMTVVVVSHFLGLVGQFADQVLFFDRESQLTLAGAPEEIFSHPSFKSQYGDLAVPHAP